MKKVLTVIIAIFASIATAFTILAMLVVSGIVELPQLNLYEKQKTEQPWVPSYLEGFDYFEYGTYRCTLGTVEVEMKITKDQSGFKYEYIFMNKGLKPVMLRWMVLDSLSKIDEDRVLYLGINDKRTVKVNSSSPPKFTTGMFVTYAARSDGFFTRDQFGSRPAPIPSSIDPIQTSQEKEDVGEDDID